MSDTKPKRQKRHVLSVTISSNNQEIYRLMERVTKACGEPKVKISDVNTVYFKNLCEKAVATIESLGKAKTFYNKEIDRLQDRIQNVANENLNLKKQLKAASDRPQQIASEPTGRDKLKVTPSLEAIRRRKRAISSLPQLDPNWMGLQINVPAKFAPFNPAPPDPEYIAWLRGKRQRDPPAHTPEFQAWLDSLRRLPSDD